MENVYVTIKVLGSPAEDIRLVLTRSTTIGELKQRIDSTTKSDVAMQKIISLEKVLEDTETLGDLLSAVFRSLIAKVWIEYTG